jgi:hypothetical protein
LEVRDVLRNCFVSFAFDNKTIETPLKDKELVEDIQLCLDHGVVFRRDPYVGGAIILFVPSTARWTISCNPYYGVGDSIMMIAHEVQHFKNRLGLNLFKLFSSMTRDEFINWNLIDEIKAVKAGYDTAKRVYPDWKSDGFSYILTGVEVGTIKDILLEHTFPCGQNYLKSWNNLYDNKFWEHYLPRSVV